MAVCFCSKEILLLAKSYDSYPKDQCGMNLYTTCPDPKELTVCPNSSRSISVIFFDQIKIHFSRDKRNKIASNENFIVCQTIDI